MNWCKFCQAIFCLSLSVAFLLPSQSALAESPGFVEIPLASFADNKPIELQGLVSSQTLNIPLPENWIPGDQNWIDIEIRASPLLDSAKSSLTVSLNELEISSYRLAKLDEPKQRIFIPAKLFAQGNNTLTFTGTLYLPDDQETNCQNWGDPSRWLSIDPGGILHLSFAEREQQIDLSNFPQPLIEPMEKYLPEQLKKQPLLVLPDNATQDDLTSLSTISHVLGRYANSNSDWNPEIISETEFDPGQFSNRNIIFIGQAPQEVRQTSNHKDYVALLPSPWSLQNAVMIIGDQDRQDGFSPASVFSDPARKLLLQGKVSFITPQALPNRPAFPNEITLKELGYLDRTVRGIGQQNLIYSLYIPYDVEPVIVKLKLGLVHSPDLDLQNSSFTIYLNGFGVAGISTADQTSSDKLIEIALPGRRFHRGINFIRIASDLHPARSSCERGIDTIWATVLNTSTLEMTYRNHVPIPSLKDFPLPFNDSNSVVVLPDDYTQEDLGYLSRLAFMMGNSGDALSHPAKVITASNFLKNKPDSHNAILVGLPSENSVIRNANNLLLQPFVEDGNSLQNGYGINLPASNKDASVGLMQIISSPWEKNGTVLVLTGNDQQGLERTWDVILNPASKGKYTGNLMVVGAGQPAQAKPQVLFQQVADAGNIPGVGSSLQRIGQAFPGSVLAAIGMALLPIVCVLWIASLLRNRNMSGRKDEHEKPEK